MKNSEKFKMKNEKFGKIQKKKVRSQKNIQTFKYLARV